MHNIFRDSSSFTINRTVPEGTTSWVLSAFSVDPNLGFAMVPQPKIIRSFKAFKIVVEIPNIVKRNEVLAVTIIVFNLLDEPIDVGVIIDNYLQQFDFVTAPGKSLFQEKFVTNSLFSFFNLTTENEVARSKYLPSTPASSTTTFAFLIKPKIIGDLQINIFARSLNGQDTFEKTITVEIEGVPQYYSESHLIDLTENYTFTGTFNIVIPQDAVPDSTQISISVVGEPLTETLENLDRLIYMPAGCGCQTMYYVSPEVSIANYLISENKFDGQIKDTLLNYMLIGYQRILTFVFPNGGVSVWVPPSTPPTVWLTAYAVKIFWRAKSFINVDQSFLTNALNFIVTNQKADGTFNNPDLIWDKFLLGGTETGIAYNAFVVMTLIECNPVLYKQKIIKTMNWILAQSIDDSDTYTLAIVTYTLQLAQYSQRAIYLQRLIGLAKKTNGYVWWEMRGVSGDPNVHNYPNALNTEATAYGCLALLLAGQTINAQYVGKWLFKQRNANGGFISTQDTVMAIEALTKLNIATGGSIIPRITFDASYSNQSKVFTIDKTNYLVIQRQNVRILVSILEPLIYLIKFFSSLHQIPRMYL